MTPRSTNKAPPPVHRFRPPPRSFVLPLVEGAADRATAKDIWTFGGTDSLVVGDVVLVTEGAEMPLVVDGQQARKVGGRTAPVRSDTTGFKVRTLRRTLATVIDINMRPQGRRGPTRTLILDVWWSEAPDAPVVGLPTGRRWNLFQCSVNADHLPKRVERLRGSGPAERTDEAGRRMLLDRLLAVAGPDPVETLRLCVDPTMISDAGTHETIGRTRAGLVLSGAMPVATWMIRQLSGAMKIPAAVDYDEREERIMDEMDFEEFAEECAD